MLTIKNIRDILEKTLRKHFDFVDFGINPTKVMAMTKEFRIEFRIYDADFWINVDPAIDSIYIGTRSFGEPDHLDSIQIWLSRPYQYDTEKFDFGWRIDLKTFFNDFHSYLKEKVESNKVAVIGEGIIGESIIAEEKDYCGVRDDIPKADKTSIFNNLKPVDEDDFI